MNSETEIPMLFCYKKVHLSHWNFDHIRSYLPTTTTLSSVLLLFTTPFEYGKPFPWLIALLDWVFNFWSISWKHITFCETYRNVILPQFYILGDAASGTALSICILVLVLWSAQSFQMLTRSTFIFWTLARFPIQRLGKTPTFATSFEFAWIGLHTLTSKLGPLQARELHKMITVLKSQTYK